METETEKISIGMARLEQQVNDLSARVERGFLEIKSNTVDRIHNLECDKADKDEMENVRKKLEEDHEIRIRRLENLGSMAIGGLFILELILKFIFK